jgi:hypothetical protein
MTPLNTINFRMPPRSLEEMLPEVWTSPGNLSAQERLT